VIKSGRETLVRPYPISIDFEMVDQLARSEEIERRAAELRNDFRFRGRILGIGIDRMDYTKGILERFDAIERLLEKHPELAGRFVFLQVGPLSRIFVSRYRTYNDELYHRVLDINERWQTKNWQPIVLIKRRLELEEVVAHYRAADFCIVSSIHDGMNLVSKEFVASRVDERGVLLLSKFTGAAKELEQAVMVNPIAVDQFADAVKLALEMAPEEQSARMVKMRQTVRENNVYRWAGKFVSDMRKLM
jgi:trehalose 6-phosphate synthase